MDKKIKMHLYIIRRSEDKDKEGRPAILLEYCGNESLVWSGTTKMNQSIDTPIKMLINDRPTFFYANGIDKVETKYLFSEWINKKTNKEVYLNQNQEKRLISKFVKFTNQQNPYKDIYQLNQTINILQIENEILKNEIVILKKENQLLKTKTLNVKDIEQEFEI